MDRTKPRLVNKPVRLDPDKWAALDRIADRLGDGSTTADLVREAVDDLVVKYENDV
jgi:hypothetical protein